MKKFKKIDCPICGSSSFIKLFTKKEEDFQKCEKCDFICINPQPTMETLSETYDESYADIYVKKPKSKYRRSKRRLQKLLKLNKNAKTFLDVGCSAGFVVKAACDLGMEGYGVEIEKSGPKYAKETLGLNNIYNGFLEDAKYKSNFFDMITFYEVIEHVPDLKSFLAEIHRIVKNDGIVQLSVPNVGHWTLNNNEKIEKWDAILPSEHLWYFSPKTMKKLLEDNNFKVLSISSGLLKPGLKATFKKV